MFAFSPAVDIDVPLRLLAALGIGESTNTRLPLLAGLTSSNTFALPAEPSFTSKPDVYGYGQQIIYNNVNSVLGVGNGYVSNVAKIAKQLRLVIPEYSSLFIIPTLFAHAKYDLLVFRDYLTSMVDGNFTVAMKHGEVTFVVTTKPAGVKAFGSRRVLTDIDNSVLELISEIRPYTIYNAATGQTLSWKGVSNRPLYLMPDNMPTKGLLLHARQYFRHDVAFLAPTGGAGLNKAEISNEDYTLLTANIRGDNVTALAFQAADIAIAHGYNAVVLPYLLPPLILRHMSDALCHEGGRKEFNFLDVNTHVLP